MKFLKEAYQDMNVYHSKLITDGIILNANESPYDLPESIKEELIKEVSSISLNRYPDTDAMELVNSIANAYSISPDMIACGVGSDELLDCLVKATIDKEYVLACDPSFSMYKQFVNMNGGKFLAVDFKDDFTFDTEAILNAVEKYDPKLAFICSPNNPTGSVIAIDDLRLIASKLNGVLAIDEAYVEFSESDALSLIHEFDNVLVFRTFSKAYSLAGIRCGYVMGNKDLIDMIKITKPAYNLNVLSIKAAKLAIDNKNLFIPNIRKIVENRDLLYNELINLGINVYKSNANFLWMELESKIVDYLDLKKIYIRKLMYNSKQYYRICIGTDSEQAILIKAIKEAL